MIGVAVTCVIGLAAAGTATLNLLITLAEFLAVPTNFGWFWLALFRCFEIGVLRLEDVQGSSSYTMLGA